ncbi:FAD-dependent monooxygenase [Frankia sp. AgB1.9]|uniref:FAD-dependent monooxygenase n=1 Tax=unclassified Frankia TaxID=2632575 RepID=UPI0019345380|nr:MULTISPECIES: FAD-dependent monooxygenase [unclassified Frankia]MBL7492310.1 FAD-dependent monooxygenase [Frankia sp. AgW1.1]MBL7551859.1 FAD-dependent monooxygenase [Frankia sp. AgB1.9]MBL7617933.1 FAD-dependent monooxygenase [Frankia sp. AgB1.8]
MSENVAGGGRVVIAGGGPAGLMLACELGLAGVDTVVVERFPEPSGYSRSLTLHVRSLEVLDQRGLNRFKQYPAVKSYNFGLVELQEHIDTSLLPLLVPQRDVEQLLEERALELGVDIRRGEEVVGFAQDDDSVTVEIRRADGVEYQLPAAYLVGCDGGSSTVRKAAGIGFPGTASTQNGLTADVLTPLDVNVFIMPTLSQNGLVAAIPLQPGLYRVTALQFGTEKTSNAIPPTREEFQERFRLCAGYDLEMLETAEIRYLSRVGNATRLADSYRSGRVFIAGDACHIHLPVSGQGLNTGIQDSLNLGWKLAATLQGSAPAGLLDTYESERRPVGQRVCWNTSAQDALLHPLDRVAALRELFGELIRLEAVNTYLMDMLTGVGIRYDMTPSSLPEATASRQADGQPVPAHPLLGLRAPNAALTTPTGPTTIADELHSGLPVLFLLGADDVAARWTDRVRVVTAEPSPEIDASVLLVRPDGYVAYAGGGPEQDGLIAALRAWFGEPTTVAA